MITFVKITGQKTSITVYHLIWIANLNWLYALIRQYSVKLRSLREDIGGFFLSRSLEILFRSLEIVFRSLKMLCLGNKIVILWERITILRERNKYFVGTKLF